MLSTRGRIWAKWCFGERRGPNSTRKLNAFSVSPPLGPAAPVRKHVFGAARDSRCAASRKRHRLQPRAARSRRSLRSRCPVRPFPRYCRRRHPAPANSFACPIRLSLPPGSQRSANMHSSKLWRTRPWPRRRRTHEASSLQMSSSLIRESTPMRATKEGAPGRSEAPRANPGALGELGQRPRGADCSSPTHRGA